MLRWQRKVLSLVSRCSSIYWWITLTPGSIIFPLWPRQDRLTLLWLPLILSCSGLFFPCCLELPIIGIIIELPMANFGSPIFSSFCTLLCCLMLCLPRYPPYVSQGKQQFRVFTPSFLHSLFIILQICVTRDHIVFFQYYLSLMFILSTTYSFFSSASCLLYVNSLSVVTIKSTPSMNLGRSNSLNSWSRTSNIHNFERISPELL